jgi:hypothetical protein
MMSSRTAVQASSTLVAVSQAVAPVQVDKNKILNLLLKISYKKTMIETEIGSLRNLFIGCPLEMISDCVKETSLKILNRFPVGQLWGSSSGANPLLNASSSAGASIASNSMFSLDKTINEYQLVHRLLSDKLNHHNNLLMAIIEAVRN